MVETLWVKKGHVCHNWVWWDGGASSAVSGLLESTTLSYHIQSGFHKYVKNVMHLLNVAMAVGNKQWKPNYSKWISCDMLQRD